MKTFYKNQLDVAEAINKIIDSYWDDSTNEKNMIEQLNKIIKNNYSKIIKNNAYTKIIQQRCGKKRIEILSEVINEIRDEN